MPRVRHDKRVTGTPLPGHVPGGQPHSSAQDMHRRLTRVLMLGQNGALEHRNDCLAQYPLVAADDRIRGVTAARGTRPFQQLTPQGFQ
jgi:hypothetical protein